MRSANRSLAALAILAGALGCNTPPTVATTDGSFHDSLRTYANLVRWGELDSAANFVHDGEREEFVALAPDLERLRFTDFDVGTVRYGEGGDFARVRVVYHAHDLKSFIEKRIIDDQVWVRGEKRNEWWVISDLTSFQKALGLPVQPPAKRAEDRPWRSPGEDDPNG